MHNSGDVNPVLEFSTKATLSACDSEWLKQMPNYDQGTPFGGPPSLKSIVLNLEHKQNSKRCESS